MLTCMSDIEYKAVDERTHRLSVNIDPELHDALVSEAAENGLFKTEMAYRILVDALADKIRSIRNKRADSKKRR